MSGVLVTGADITPGLEVAQALHARGERVRALVSWPTPARAPLPPGVERAQVDLSRRFALPRLLEGCDRVVHLAVPPTQADRDTLYRYTLEHTGHLLTAAREAGVARFILRSSVFALGLGEHGRPADEDVEWNLGTSRSAMVHASRLAWLEALRQGSLGLPMSAVFPTFLVGPGVSGGILSWLRRASQLPLIGAPPGGLDVVDPRDVARSIVAALDHPAVGRSWILGGQFVRWRLLLEHVATLTGARRPIFTLPPKLVAWGATVTRPEAALPKGSDLPELLGLPLVFDSRRARAELGHRSRPWQESLGDGWKEEVREGGDQFAVES